MDFVTWPLKFDFYHVFVQGNSVFFMSKNITLRTVACLIDQEILLRLMASK